MSTTDTRHRSSRLSLRTTPEERELIDRAAEVSGSDLTAFVISSTVAAARRVELDARALAAWERINARHARNLPGLRRLMARPSPFGE